MPGHIQKRNGRYILRLYMRGEDGRQREISRSFATETEAKAAQEHLSSHVLTHAAQLGPYGDPNGRFGNYLKEWLHRQQNLAPSSFKRAEDVLKRVSHDLIATLRYSRLTPKIFEAYYQRLAERGLSPSTIRRHHAVIRKAINDGVREEIMLRNPARLVKLPRARRPEIEVCSEAQILLLLSEPSRFQPVYRFAATTVSRQGETLGLPWSRVNIDKQEVLFTQALQPQKGGGYFVKEPKTPKSRRAHPLTPETVALLRAVREHQQYEKKKRPPCALGMRCRQRLCKGWHETGLVFTLPNGKPIHQRNLLRDLQETGERLGLPAKNTFHALRHFAASYLLENGINPREVMELGGWSSASFFLSVYAHALPGGHEKVVSVMSNLLSRASPVTLEVGESRNSRQSRGSGRFGRHS